MEDKETKVGDKGVMLFFFSEHGSRQRNVSSFLV